MNSLKKNTYMQQETIDYKKLIKQEYIKCSRDPIYFMMNYCIIQHPQRGKIKFKLYDFQQKVLNDLIKHKYNIILKSRQLGISTLTAGYSLWLMTFQSDKNILVIATKQEVAKNLVTKVRVMYEELPNWLKNESVEDNKLSLRFKNGSQIKAISTSSGAGRSEALSLLILDESCDSNTIIKIKNKKTKEIKEIEVKNFFDTLISNDIIKDKLDNINFIIKNTLDYKIWNGKRWCNFSGIMEKDVIGLVALKFNNGSEIKGSLNHKIEIKKNIFQHLKDINIGDEISGDSNNNLIVINKTININIKNKLYDVLNIKDGNKYQTNNIISHNCAFLPYADEIWTAAQQTLATGGRCIALSTPNGLGNWFHRTWAKAEAGENGFNFIRLPWQVHPERDQTWRNTQETILGSRMAKQECLSGDCVVEIYDNSNKAQHKKIMSLEEIYNNL